MLMDRPRKSLSNKHNFIYPNDTGKEYKKALGIVLSFLLISGLITFSRGWGLKYLWQDFMAILLIFSAAYKMFRYEEFIKIFSLYDIIAIKFKPWPYIYPFIEVTIGANLLLTNGSISIYLLTIIFSSQIIYSVLKQRSHNLQSMFACLDNNLRIPISLISFFEGIILLIFSLFLLVFYR